MIRGAVREWDVASASVNTGLGTLRSGRSVVVIGSVSTSQASGSPVVVNLS